MSRVLCDLGKEYGNEAWLEASKHFDKGAVVISEIKDVIVSYLTGEHDGTGQLPEMFAKAMEIMSDGLVPSGIICQ